MSDAPAQSRRSRRLERGALGVLVAAAVIGAVANWAGGEAANQATADRQSALRQEIKRDAAIGEAVRYAYQEVGPQAVGEVGRPAVPAPAQQPLPELASDLRRYPDVLALSPPAKLRQADSRESDARQFGWAVALAVAAFLLAAIGLLWHRTRLAVIPALAASVAGVALMLAAWIGG